MSGGNHWRLCHIDDRMASVIDIDTIAAQYERGEIGGNWVHSTVPALLARVRELTATLGAVEKWAHADDDHTPGDQWERGVSFAQKAVLAILALLDEARDA